MLPFLLHSPGIPLPLSQPSTRSCGTDCPLGQPGSAVLAVPPASLLVGAEWEKERLVAVQALLSSS